MEKKKNSGLKVVIIIIILLLLLFAIWFFLLKDKDTTKESKDNNTEEKENKDVPKDDPKPNVEKEHYVYLDGVLTEIVDEDGEPKQTSFIIDGVILLGNRHDISETDSDIETLVKEGYKKEDIMSSFYLNEWIEIYLDTDYSLDNDDVLILVTPHRTVEEYDEMTFEQLTLLAAEYGSGEVLYETPDEDNYKYVNSFYIHQELPEGKYDILFTYKEKIAYFICIDLTKEE